MWLIGGGVVAAKGRGKGARCCKKRKRPHLQNPKGKERKENGREGDGEERERERREFTGACPRGQQGVQ